MASNIHPLSMRTCIQWKTFKDEDTAADMMDAPDAQSAKMLSHKVNGFDAKKWNGLISDFMFTLLRITFKPGSKFATKLLATGNKHLAESGRGFYACGLSITDKKMFWTSLNGLETNWVICSKSYGIIYM